MSIPAAPADFFDCLDVILGDHFFRTQKSFPLFLDRDGRCLADLYAQANDQNYD